MTLLRFVCSALPGLVAALAAAEPPALETRTFPADVDALRNVVSSMLPGNADTTTVSREAFFKNPAEALRPLLTTLGVEWIYPTTFTDVPIATNAATGTVTTRTEPGGFETREVGVTFTALPESSADNDLVTLTLAPELCTGPVWRKPAAGSRAVRGAPDMIRQPPDFETWKLTQSVNIRSGTTALLGSMTAPMSDRQIFVLVTARVLGADLKPIVMPAVGDPGKRRAK